MGKLADEGVIPIETSQSGPTVYSAGVEPLPRDGPTSVEEIEEAHKSRFAYFKTKDFYLVVAIGLVREAIHVLPHPVLSCPPSFGSDNLIRLSLTADVCQASPSIVYHGHQHLHIASICEKKHEYPSFPDLF